MKSKIILLALIIAATLNIQAQSDSTDQNTGDTTTISFGKTKWLIIGNNFDENTDEDSIKSKGIESQRSDHFAGVDIGINGLLNDRNSVNLQDEANFMDLTYRKSISIALNPWEWFIPIAKEKFGVSSGLGVEFNNYTLSRDFTIFSDEDTTVGVVDKTKNIEKNKFKSTFINVPIFLETNLGKDAEHSFHLAIGGQVSYRLGSKTKQIFDQSGKEYKEKNRNDYNMNDFRFNAVARIGYGKLNLFAAYSLTPIFDTDKGPELYPFTAGISLAAW